MRPGPICDIFNRFLFRGLELKVFDAVQPHVVSGVAPSFSLRSAANIGMLTNGGVTPHEYLELIGSGRFSAVFFDGSILSVECRFNDETIWDHRYYYIPCPFVEEVVVSRTPHIPLWDWLSDSLILEGSNCLQSKGALRFDCVRDGVDAERGDPHPISHLTFASSECRIPVRGPLQLAAFLHFIFDNYYRDYRDVWLGFAPYLPNEEIAVTISEEESSRPHLNWLADGFAA